MKIIKYLSIFILTFLSCSPTPKMYVSNVNTIDEFENNSMIYSLPQSVVHVTAKVRKNTFIPGPYASYADKYMAIKGVGEKPSENWAFTEFLINTYSETDPDYYYSVRMKNDGQKFKDEIKSLTDAGLIITNQNLSASKPIISRFNSGGAEKEITFTDLSVKRNLIEEKETSYKRVLRDSVYVQVPVENKKLSPKTLEQKAEEAANFIIKLRKRKFKMLTGQDDSIGVGPGVQPAVEELTRIENEYLSLFIGKTETENYEKTFEYTPLANEESQQVILFNFSETEGILDVGDSKGNQVFLEIKALNTTKSLYKFKPDKEIVDVENTMFYRLPENVKISIKEDNEVLLEGKTTVFQLGALLGIKINEE